MENNKINNKEKGCSKLFKLLTIIILSISILFASNILEKNVVFADSGFDFSYDSGGSSDWGSSSSDWGSSSSDWGSSSHSGSSGNSSSGEDNEIIGYIVMMVVIVMYIIVVTSSNKKRQEPTAINAINVAIDQEVVNKVKQHLPNFDKKVFMEDTYKIYLDVQNAWMNFNLDDVRSKITDEMFNMYQSQLDTLKVKGEQNIMKNFKLVSSNLKDVSVQNDNITITACYVVDFYDYIVEQTTGKVLRGSPSIKMRVTYSMKFRKTLNKALDKGVCPNCGAKLENINGAGVCQYCGSKIVSENSDWILTDKKITNQRRA